MRRTPPGTANPAHGPADQLVVSELALIGQPSGPEADLNILLCRVAAGDRDAFGAVYEELCGAVYGLARRVLRDAARAEEVAQDVMVEVWRSATRFRPERGTAKTWVMTLAHHRAVDRVRSARAATAREQRSAGLDREPVFDGVSEPDEVRLEHEQVRGCLGALTELQRNAITLAYYEGLTYREVAARLAAPLGTTTARLRDALIRLRDCMS